MEDPRHGSYITYTKADLIYMGILKNICSVDSMRQMEEKFNEQTCIETLRLLSGDNRLEEMPHYDTLNYYLEKLPSACLSGLRRKMIKALLRGKQFYRSRLLGKWLEIHFYPAWHKTEDSRRKLYVDTGKRRRNDRKNIGKELGTGKYVNHMEEVAGKEEMIHVYGYEYDEKGKKEEAKRKVSFEWLTNIELTKRNLEEMTGVGRGRWKIENEGFNNQKHGIYRIEHLNSRDSNAMKNHYLLAQIADLRCGKLSGI